MGRHANNGTAPPEAGVYVPDEPTPSSYRSLRERRRRRRPATLRALAYVWFMFRHPWRWAQRRKLLSATLLAAVLAGAIIGGVIYLQPPPKSLVVASVPYWNINYGTATVLANPRTFSEMSPWMYGLDASGQIVPQYPPEVAA